MLIIRRIWNHLWKTNFVGMSFAMGTIPLLLFALVVSSCTNPQTGVSDHRTGHPVVIEVTDGRTYDCVQLGGGQTRVLIDCQERKQ